MIALSMDEELMKDRMEISNMENKIQHLTLELSNLKNILSTMKEDLSHKLTRKRYVLVAEKEINRNKRRLVIDQFNEKIDEIKNSRPEGTCQFIKRNNRRCTNPAVDELDGRDLCSTCLNQALREKHGFRKNW